MKQRKGIPNGKTITSNADQYDNTAGDLERVAKIYQWLAILLQLFIHFPSYNSLVKKTKCTGALKRRRPTTIYHHSSPLILHKIFLAILRSLMFSVYYFPGTTYSPSYSCSGLSFLFFTIIFPFRRLGEGRGLPSSSLKKQI